MSKADSATAVPNDYGAAALELGLTQRLGEYLAELSFDQLPDEVVHAARRGSRGHR